MSSEENHEAVEPGSLPHSSHLVSLIRRIAKQIKYRQLDSLIGKEVTVHSPETVPVDVCTSLGQDFPAGCEFVKPEARWRESALQKYGMLDLHFRAPAQLLGCDCECGIPLLKQLEFVWDPSEENPWEELAEAFGNEAAQEDPTCLSMLEDDLAKGETWLRLYLTIDPPEGRHSEPSGHVQLPSQSAPRSLVVRDACVTNAGSVWFHKHFYW